RLWFNTIREPAKLALHNLTRSELATIHDTVSAQPLPVPPDDPSGQALRDNLGMYRGWLRQVATWRDDAGEVPSAEQGVPVVLRQS
ncbi:MAG: hypothetical protein KDB24_16020, partial [Microthrixaceae bacterium]|nr:hypothetical protein [Microthrixaceae bacterium]